MPIQHHVVQGEDVRLVVLPRYTEKALEAWQRFIESDEIFGLDVETTAPPKFEKHLFGPALARADYVVPDDVPETYRKRGFEPGARVFVKTRAIQFGSPTEGWVFDADDLQWEPHIVAFLRDLTKRFVSHNAAFDAVRVLHRYGVRLGRRSIDTLVLAGILHPGRTAPTRNHEKGLKELCVWHLEDDGLLQAEKALHARMADLYPRATTLPKNFEPGVSKCRNCGEAPSIPGSVRGHCQTCYDAAVGFSQAVLEWGFTHLPLTDPVFQTYAGLDAVYVRRLLPVLGALVRQRGMNAVSRDEQTVKRVMVARSVKGLKVDVEWTERVLDEINDEFKAAKTEVIERTGLTSARSPKLRTEWLPEHGVRVKSLDKDHRPGLLLQYGEDPEVGPVLQAYDTLMSKTNLLANLQTILRHAEGGDGYVHPQINTLQAHTTRMSVTAPAMQTFKKEDPRLRGCFIFEDGYVGVGADWDNQETRIAAALSGDPNLTRIVVENLNQHVLTSESIFSDFVSKEESPGLYHKGKTLDFAQQYGAMPKKIAATLGITVQEATDMWLGWRATYAGLVAWSDRLSRQQWIRNPFGLLIPADEWGRSYANSNYMIQSTGRSLLGRALVRLAEAGWGSSVWLPIHDEIVLQVPEERALDAEWALTDAMTMHLPQQAWAPILSDVVIPATGETIGHRWRGLA